ncbi:MAG: transglycosylase SLT domain-containing protein [Thermodesulfobacteriota bacterium]
MKHKYLLLNLALFMWMTIPGTARAAAETVTIPLTLDYALIRMALNEQLYDQPGGRAVIVDEKTGINSTYIAIWNPEIRSENGLIVTGSSIQVKQGARLLGAPIDVFKWEGYIELYQRVILDEKGTSVRLKVVDSRLYAASRKPVAIDPAVVEMIQDHIRDFFSDLAFDLDLPMDEIRAILPSFFARENKAQLDQLLSSLKVSDLRVDPDAIRLTLSMIIETPPPAAEEPPLELSAEEMERVSELWELWDAFLIYQMGTLLQGQLTDEERQRLLETLLELRYGFVRAVNDKTAGNDLVRQQFVYAWEQLSGILRNRLGGISGQGKMVKYLAFFTAADVLSALDKLGPTLGIEISRDGLIRMAQLISDQEIDLGYSLAVDDNLRKLMGFAPSMDESGPAYHGLEIPLPEEGEPVPPQKDELAPAQEGEPAPPQEVEPTPPQETAPAPPVEVITGFILRLLIAPAYAEEAPAPPDLEALKQWLAPKDNLGPYLARVRQVLEKTADEALANNKLDASLQPMYRLMIMATAWQESCWRQFITVKGNMTPLLSYNQSSVGLMQINQRIWRGFYKVESLRWNIEYNAKAGAEILAHYLKDYALKKMDPANPLSHDLLSRALYAMYNGGPGDFKKFLQRNQTQTFYESDKLFWDKYSMAKAGELEKVSICLTGK